jgi:hypothetical protein
VPIASNWNRVRGLLCTYMKIKELIPIRQITLWTTGILILWDIWLGGSWDWVPFKTAVNIIQFPLSFDQFPVYGYIVRMYWNICVYGGEFCRICACMAESFVRVWRRVLHMCVYGGEFWEDSRYSPIGEKAHHREGSARGGQERASERPAKSMLCTTQSRWVMYLLPGLTSTT